jgi:MATE family multidrug resistance protein
MAEDNRDAGQDAALLDRLSERWTRPAGYRDVLRLAIPLVLSTGSWSIQHFVDRMFLCWHSSATMAAAMPSGILAFTLMSFFIGTASYANAMVAQYHGADRPQRVGPAVWQAIYFALLAGVLLPLFAPFSGSIFRWIGHEAEIQILEARYFRILMTGAVFSIYSSAIATYFTGLGRNWPVMWVHVGVTAVNLTLDYGLIFGHWGLPALGIEGAAVATVSAHAVGATAFSFLVFSRKNAREHATRRGWRFDRELFGRLMRFGAPSGVQFMLDVLAFTFFLFIVGRLGTVQLAATTVGFQINTLAFLPMIGFGIATTTLVGQWLGRDKPDLAARATWSAFHLTFAYMVTMAVLYVTVPWLFIDPFAVRADPEAFREVRRLAVVILYFVAVYSVFDTMNIIFASALKGAGDTRFVMFFSVGLAWAMVVVPTWLFAERAGGGILAAWAFISVYVITLGFGFLTRFLRGKWRTMRVIERRHAAPVPVPLPETPTSEVDM